MRGLDKPDFFSVTGVAMMGEDPQRVKVCGHSFVFTYNLKDNVFEDSTLIW